MSLGIEELNSVLERAVSDQQLIESAVTNIRSLLGGAELPLYEQAVTELVEAEAWSELNDRFYKTLAFGTGGLRGRTIGKIVTKAERGQAQENEPPEFPCVGTNAMNFYNISRATQGLVAYVKEWRTAQRVAGRAKIVIAYDTRHFSKAFAALAAKVVAESGCDACLFEDPRSTPELSFAVRELRASAGIVITASHNPPHDNGYKVYFDDGAQVVEPHASGIIAKVNVITTETYPAFAPNPPSPGTGSPVTSEQGKIATLGAEIDEAYMGRLETLILNPELIAAQKSLHIVYTPIHGTGAAIIKPMLKRLGFNFQVVAEQDRFDGNFPTVQSPNPENAEALRLGIELATKTNADLVIATDPDCDRVGVAVRSRAGEMKLLTGNQIGSLMAYYRAKTFFESGVLNKENASRGVIIKTFVTTDLQKAIAQHYGLRAVETLTGFKYIGAKLGKYERALGRDGALPRPNGAARRPYQEMSEDQTRRLRLQHSAFYVFGGEESYGYSGADFVRDKDGNGATIMFCEVAAYAKSKNLTLDALLDEIYATFGYYTEKNGALTFEGAEGAAKIKRLLESYVTNPPGEMLGSKVVAVKNFETETFRDVEGDEIPKEKMLIFELADKTRIAVRGSGTEPKIKYYMFAQRSPDNGKFTPQELGKIKRESEEHLEQLWRWVQEDAHARLLR
jgi:phosphoglucomutase